MNPTRLETLQAGGLRMKVAVHGSGPLVLLVHGFPETWRTWRHQLAALAEAGFCVAAPDMRGYGGTEAPTEPERYTMLHLVGDLVALLKALGERRAVLVGHDWGAAVAWHAALLRPDLFHAVAGLSVPYTPPSAVHLVGALRSQGVHDFYMQHFQVPGVAEAGLEADVAASVRRIQFSGSGDGPDRVTFGRVDPALGFVGAMAEPERLPHWLSETDIAHDTVEFTRTGFRGGLNWYRNFERNSELLAPWHGAPVRQPSLFIAGSRDDVLKFPFSLSAIDRYPRTLPGLRGCHVIEGAGHWVQRERAAEVNRLLLDFLRGL